MPIIWVYYDHTSFDEDVAPSRNNLRQRVRTKSPPRLQRWECLCVYEETCCGEVSVHYDVRHNYYYCRLGLKLIVH